MAGQIPDPRTLNSWEDAFQHPLPVVRKLEQQLRKNIDDNRQKLRSLVGASYRDLLGTAERIIEMDQQMETVESNLGDIGRRCNARTVERIAENGAQMRKSLNAREGDKYGAMAQTKILNSALTVVSRIVKAGGDALQASKLLVLSRLLYKSISEGSLALPMHEELRRKLALLRKRLLSYITANMVKPSKDKSLQANTLCAYALITSSTPKEVLRHFLQARYEQLDSHSEAPSEAEALELLDLYSQTLLDTRDLFPRRFSESLMLLAKLPLIHDGQVQSAFELNLDIYGQWIADDVRTFTPWVRHDQVTSSEVADALGSWTRQAQACLLRGVEELVQKQNDATKVADIRRKVLSKYMSLSGKLRDGNHTKMIHALREACLRKLQDLAMESADLGDLNFNEPSSSDTMNLETRSTWGLAAEDLDLSHGALKFRRSVVQLRNSRDASIQAAGDKLDDWTRRIRIMLDLIDNMRMDKWDSELDFDFDDLDDNEALRQALNKHDPEKLRDTLRDAAAGTLQQLGEQVISPGASSHPAFYMRISREVDQRQRALNARLAITTGEVSLSALYQNLSQSVCRDPVAAYVQSLKKQSRPAVELWDGSPPLPIQPSPATFRLLKMLHQAMSSAGHDLWGPNAVRELKAQTLDSLSTQLVDDEVSKLVLDSKVVNGHSEDKDEGDSEEKLTNGVDVVNDSRRDWQLQYLFDVQYLRCVLKCRDQSDTKRGDLTGVVNTLHQQLELDSTLNERLEKNASEYWRRTYLLFGLIATG